MIAPATIQGNTVVLFYKPNLALRETNLVINSYGIVNVFIEYLLSNSTKRKDIHKLLWDRT